MRLLKILFFHVFGFFFFSGYAQESKTISLQKLIPKLEKQYNLQFNYVESHVKKQVFYQPNLTLESTLNSLEKQTQLRFELVDEKQLIIRELKPSDLVSVCGLIVNDGFTLSQVEVQPVLTLKTTYTNDNGYFELKDIPYKSNVVFRIDDVFLRSVPVASLFKPKCVAIDISFHNEELEEVTLASYISKGVTKKAQKVVISPEKLSLLAGITEPDIMKSLEHIPSIQSPFELASKLHVRGSTPDQNLVLWNGIRTYSQSHFFGLLSAFNPYVIDQVNYYSKAVQAKYGDRLAGVIDIETDPAVHNEFEGGVGLNMISGDAFAKVPLITNKLSLVISARRAYTDVFKTPTFTPMAERVFQNTQLANTNKENDDFYFLDYSIGLQAKPSKKDRLQFNTFFAENKLDFTSGNNDVNYSDNLTTRNEGYSLKWQHQYTEKLSQESVMSLSNYNLDYNFLELEFLFGKQTSEERKNFVSDYGVQTFFKLDLNNENKTDSHIQLGYQFSSNAIRYIIENNTTDFLLTLDEQRNELRTHSLFSEYEIDFNSKSLIQLGMRANKYSTNNKLFLEPRLYAEATVFPNFKFNASATATSQSVTQIQESITSNITLENLLWRITDERDFNILKSQQYSLGAIYKHKNWFIEGDSFHKATQNITTLTAGFLDPLNNGFNKGESRTVGLELFIKREFKKYSSWISYTFTKQQSKFDSINDNEYFISNLNIDHTFKWQHYWQINDFQFSLGWLWHSGRATTNVTANKEEGKPVELIFTDLNNLNLPVYHKLDFSVIYNFKFNENKKTRYQLGISLNNVYNRKRVLNREFRTTAGIDNELLTLDFNSLGFTPNASLHIFW